MNKNEILQYTQAPLARLIRKLIVAGITVTVTTLGVASQADPSQPMGPDEIEALLTGWVGPCSTALGLIVSYAVTWGFDQIVKRFAGKQTPPRAENEST